MHDTCTGQCLRPGTTKVYAIPVPVTRLLFLMTLHDAHTCMAGMSLTEWAYIQTFPVPGWRQ